MIGQMIFHLHCNPNKKSKVRILFFFISGPKSAFKNARLILVYRGSSFNQCIIARQLKLGSKLIESSLELAKLKNTEFYVTRAVSSFAKRIFEKFGFQSINSLSYRDYFKNDPEVLLRLEPNHEEAFFMIKKL